jgi:hypothetical protein
MERTERDRWARLVDAARRVNGGAAPAPEPDAVRVAIEQTRQSAPRRLTGLRSPWLAARVLGALAVLAVGAVHLQQYEMLYSAIPTIGTLFVLNFAGATAIGLALLAPLETVLGPRWGAAAVGVLVLAGIGLGATAFAFLAIAEQTPLFGFMEPGYDPTAILASRIAEGVAVVSLGAYGVGRFLIGAPGARW